MTQEHDESRSKAGTRSCCGQDMDFGNGCPCVGKGFFGTIRECLRMMRRMRRQMRRGGSAGPCCAGDRTDGEPGA
jgi:hypothetical protein